LIKAFGLEEEQIDRYREYTRQSVHHSMKNVQARELIIAHRNRGHAWFGTLIVFVFYKGLKSRTWSAFYRRGHHVYAD